MNTKYLAGIVSVNRMKPGNSIGNQITNLEFSMDQKKYVD